MTKKVSFAPKPNQMADHWVKGGSDTSPPTRAGDTSAEKMKRLTIDIPASLHTRIKIACAQRGNKMADEIRDLLEQTFPENPINGKS